MEIQPKNKRIYRTIEEKIEIVKYTEQYSIHKTFEKYDIDRQNIRTLKNQLPNLIAITKMFSKMIMHSGQKPETEDKDEQKNKNWS